MKKYNDYSEEGKRKAVEEVRAENERKRKEREEEFRKQCDYISADTRAYWKKCERRQKAICYTVALGIAVASVLGIKGCVDHERFLENHCKVVQIRDGKSVIGFGIGGTSAGNSGAGIMTGYQSGETTYQCDDGITRIE